MSNAINGADRKPEDRITLQAFVQAKEIFSPSKARPTPIQSRTTLLREEQARDTSGEEVTAELNLPEETHPHPVEPVHAALLGEAEPANSVAAHRGDAGKHADISIAELRVAIETAFHGPDATEFERHKAELSSWYPNTTTSDVIRALGADRAIPLAKALAIFDLEPYPDPSEMQPGVDQDAWYEIIQDAQLHAIKECDVETEYVTFLQENYRFPNK